MNSLKTVVLGAAAGLLALGGVTASAQSLIELDCDQCVDRDDIAQRTITTSKLKYGAVKEHKLGRDVRDRLDTIESRFEFVSVPGTVFLPVSPS
jgi:hypothetical protein